MGLLSKGMNVLIVSFENLIERLADPARDRYALQALQLSNRRLAELVEENWRLNDRIEELEKMRASGPIPVAEPIASAASVNCVCGNLFRTAEDFRDHLPCEGSMKWR